MRRFWKSVIQPIFEAENIAKIIEIGSDKGENTRQLLHYAIAKDGVLYAIDPFPSFPYEEWEKSSDGHFKMITDLSLNVLDKIELADVVLIDGDHNWYTVYHELMTIKKHYTKKFPIIFFHDICWPYDRRDLYYNPDNIPALYRNNYKKSAISPDNNELVECGLNRNLLNAVDYGTEHNGVKTAVEDFINNSSELGLKYYEFNCIHGLGMLVPENEYKRAVEIFTSVDTCRNVITDAEQDRLRVQMLLEKARSSINTLKDEIYTLKNGSYYMFKIYPDFGEGFSEATAIRKEYYSGNVCEEISFPKAPLRLRVDPVEKSYCVVSAVSVFSDKGVVTVSKTNGKCVDDVYCFDIFDSMLIFENIEKASTFNISMNITPFSSVDILEGFDRIDQSIKEIQLLDNQIIEIKNKLAQAVSDKNETEAKLAQVVSDKNETEIKLAQAVSDKNETEAKLAQAVSVSKKLSDEKTALKDSFAKKDIEKEKNFLCKINDANQKLIETQKKNSRYEAIINADRAVGTKLVAASKKIGWNYALKSIFKNGIRATVANIKGMKYIRKNGEFDLLLYCRRYPDVYPAMDPLVHFIWFGGYEGRNPSDKFRTSEYLNAYSDVKKSCINPYVHYMLYGKSEKRKSFVQLKKASAVIAATPSARSTSTKTNTKKSVNSESSTEIIDAQAGFSLRAYGYSNIANQLSLYKEKIITIIVPVYNAYDETAECIEYVLKNTDFPYKLMLINDCSPDERIKPLLDSYKDNLNVEVVHNTENLGFVRTVNYGMTHSENDVVFLNSDTKVTKGWLKKLAVAACHTDNIATVTPFSNAAGAFNVPVMGKNDELPEGFSLEAMNGAVEKSSLEDYVRVPTGNGFCMFVTRRAIDAVGLLDYDAFSRGYGEENDFCMRAKKTGFINIIADDTYIYHKRSASFKEDKLQLIAEHRKILDQRYPTYSEEIKIFSKSKELCENRSRIAAIIDKGDSDECAKKRILYVLHEGTGGTVKTNEDLMSYIDRNNFYEVFMLTSDTNQMKLYTEKGGKLYLIKSWKLNKKWNIVDFYVKEYADIYFDVMFGLHIDLVHVRHLFKHSFDVMDIAKLLNIPVGLSFHDFYFICPTINLVNSDNRYCNAECRDCDQKCFIPSGYIKINGDTNVWTRNIWQKEVSRLLEKADFFVTTSDYTEKTYLKIYPEIKNRFHVIEHGRDFDYERKFYGKAPENGKIKILLAGNMNPAKGSDYIISLAKADYEKRIEFHCIGGINEELKPYVTYHGKYIREDFLKLVSEIAPAYIGVFSIWPETYCHVLSEAWSCGVPCVVSDIGTLAERANAHGGCILCDLNNPEKACNDIIRISFSEEYNKLVEEAVNADIHSINRMGAEYAALYNHVLQPEKTDALFMLGEHGPKYVASTHIRILSPIIKNRYITDQCTVYRINKSCDIPFDSCVIRKVYVIVQREKISAAAVDELVKLKEYHDNIRVIFEIDDDLMSIDENHYEYSTYINSLAKIRKVSNIADKLITTTDTISSKYTCDSSIIPNYIDDRIWKIKQPVLSDKKHIKILYMGTVTHQQDLDVVKGFFSDLVEKLSLIGISVELDIIGCTSILEPWFKSIPVPSECKEYPAFVAWLKKNNDFDIGIAPLELSVKLNHAKSYLKYLEYSAMGLPGVFTSIEPYNAVIQNGMNGFVIQDNDKDAWVSTLEELCCNAEKRFEIACNAHNDLVENHILSQHFEEIAKAILE